MPEFQGCPGARMVQFHTHDEAETEAEETGGTVRSQLRQWPIQLHLIQPTAPYYQGADVLLTADCVAYALGGFHPEFLANRALAIACPKLDQGQEIYAQKVKAWFDEAKINTLQVVIMQVPCCRGLLNLAQQAAREAERKVPIKYTVISLQGQVLEEAWLST